MADCTAYVRAAPALYTSFARYGAAGYVADGYLESFEVAYAVSGAALCQPAGVLMATAVGAVAVAGSARAEPGGLAVAVTVGSVSVLISAAQWAGAAAPGKPRRRTRGQEEDAFLLCVLL